MAGKLNLSVVYKDSVRQVDWNLLMRIALETALAYEHAQFCLMALNS